MKARAEHMGLAELKNRALGFDSAKERMPLRVGKDKLDGWKAIWNIDRNKCATVVSKKYHLIQHKEVVQSVVDALFNLNLKAQARVQDNGNSIFVDLTFEQEKVKLQEGEEFFAGIRVINSYNKTTGIVIAPRWLRCVCSNGMVVDKIIPGFSVKHTKKLTEDFESVVNKLLRKMINSTDELRKIVDECIGDSIEWELLDKILRKLSGAEKHFKEIRKKLPRNPTRWDVYNAFTEYATHGKQLKPTVEQRLQMESQKVLTTPLVELVPPEKEKDSTTAETQRSL